MSVQRSLHLRAVVDNPIIRREAVPRRLRRAGPLPWLGLASGAVLVPFIIAGVAAQRNDWVTDWADALAYFIAFCWAAVISFVASAHTCRAIVQERALGTWDALVISRLGAKGIVFGKLLGTLLPLWMLGLVILPALMLLVDLSATTDGALPLWIAYGLAIAGSASFASLGLYCSMRSWTAAGSQAATAAVIAGLVILPPLLTAAVPSHLWLNPTTEGVWGIAYAAVVLLPGFLALLHLLLRFDKLDKARRR
ncbi:MAG: hypothetical protein JSV65_11850 [Armatimonadota bacterium]|nr:MAG: hypothetical protein JSV65_11850 [Armatimonadota bacterium]